MNKINIVFSKEEKEVNSKNVLHINIQSDCNDTINNIEISINSTLESANDIDDLTNYILKNINTYEIDFSIDEEIGEESVIDKAIRSLVSVVTNEYDSIIQDIRAMELKDQDNEVKTKMN